MSLSRTQVIVAAVAACVVAIVAIVLVTRDGGGEDPREVLERTFSGEGEEVRSGVIDASFEVTSEGEQAGSFRAAAQGPFQSTDGGVPQFDLDVEAAAEGDQSFSFSGGISSTGERAFVTALGSSYETDAATFDALNQIFVRLQQEGERDDDSDDELERTGVDPSDWLTDLSNEGREDVEGAETIHVSGRADIGRFVEDVAGLAERSGAGVPAEQLEGVEESIKRADFDVYSGVDDERLRRLDATIEIEPPEAEGGVVRGTIEFHLVLSGLNEEQEISAPSEARPLAQLLRQIGIDERVVQEALRQGAAAGAQGDGGGGGEGTGQPAPPADGDTQAYLECLREARGEAAVEACQELLQ